jgi:uncharacterized membrane protein
MKRSFWVAAGVLLVASFFVSERSTAPEDTGARGAETDVLQEALLPPTGARAEGFVPGGVPVTAPAGVSVATLRITGETESAIALAEDHENPALRSLAIHRRSRVFSLNQTLDLRPPAIGDEDQAARRLVFDLFPDVSLVGQVTRLERHGPDQAVYFGTLEGVAGGDFILGYHRGVVVAAFTTPERGSFQIRYVGDGYHAAIELEPAAFPKCDVQVESGRPAPLAHGELADIRVRAALHEVMAAAPVAGSTYGGVGQQGGDGAGLAFTEVDLLIVHTTAATAAAGGPAGMGAVIDVSVARANSAFINSDIGLRLRLVRTEEVAYTEGTLGHDLSNLRDGNGALSSVPTWRNESGADLVSLFVSGAGGLAYVFNGSANAGFSVTGQAGAESTLVHEIGHNLGCLHDRQNDFTPNPLYPYSYGWRFTPDDAPELRTIMAYAPGASIPYFSNPEITYMGAPTGVPIGETNQSHNAQVVRNSKAAVAAFRGTAGNMPPDVILGTPGPGDGFAALDPVVLTASANDPDGSVMEVRFYRLKSDREFGFSNFQSLALGSVFSSPFGMTEELAPAGYWTYAAVAIDNQGGIGMDTVSVTVSPHYRRTELALPGGKLRVNVEGINESGRVVGFGHNGNANVTNTQAAYWENGSITLLNPLPGDTGAKALAVGNDGVIYGESISGAGVRRAVWWNQSVTPTDISAVIDDYSAESALGVDELGRVYVASGMDFRRFDDPGSTSSGLNQRFTKATNNGQFVAGHDYDFGVAAFVAMRWQGSGTQLASLPGYLSSWGRAVNRSGSVFGFSGPQATAFGSSTNRLTFWPAGQTAPVDLGTLGAAGGWAYDLNDFNHAVGTANHPAVGGLGIIWRGAGDLLDVNQLVLPDAGLIREARAINNRGQIAATGFSGSDQVLYFLDPLPGLSHEYWLSGHFTAEEIEAGLITGDLNDPDGDGLPNLLERALGLDPRVPYAALGGGGALPEVSVGEDGHLYFVIRRLRPPRDLAYVPELSLALTSGSWDENLLEVVEVTAIDSAFEEVQLRSVAPVAEEDRAFARLRVER